MTDYQPLLARAVSTLDPNTGEARRGIYDRARQALLNQLRAVNPPLADADITRERLALEEAIRKIETEAAQKHPHTVRPSIPRTAALLRPEEPSAPRVSPNGVATPRVSPPVTQTPRVQPTGAPTTRSTAPAISGVSPAMRSPAQGLTSRTTAPHHPQPMTSDRHEMRAPANGGPSREPYSDNAEYRPTRGDRLPPDIQKDDVLEADFDSDTAHEPPRRRGAELERRSDVERNRITDRARPPTARAPQPEVSPEDFTPTPRPRGARAPVQSKLYESSDKAKRTKILIAGFVVLLVAAASLFGYQHRARILGLLGIDRSGSSQVIDNQPKTGERIAPNIESQQRPAPTPSNVDPAVAQRAVLYEENPGGGQQFQNFVGTAVWKTETVSLGAGRAPDLGLRVDVDIPDRKIGIVINFRRNTDASFPASHTIEVQFKTLGDPFGGVSEMRGLRAKSSETAQGTPIQAAVEKVKEGFFLLALPVSEEDANLSLLRDRGWLDIPFVYNNGRRAVLTFQKGTPGDRAVNEALQSWGK